MANNTIKRRSHELYSKVKNNLNVTSQTIIEEFLKLDNSQMHEYRNSILVRLYSELDEVSEKIVKENLFVTNIDWNKYSVFDLYSLALDEMGMNIFKTIEIIPKEIYEEIEEIRAVRTVADYLKPIILKVEDELKITGKVIDFLLEVLPTSLIHRNLEYYLVECRQMRKQTQ